MASRATIGTVRIAGIDLATNQGFISFVCDERKLHHRFLYYVISGFLGEYFAQIAPGTTFFEISRGKAKIEPICFPTLPEQARIAAYLDASCAAIDAAVAAKRRQIETLDKLQQLFITKAITRGIEESVKLKYSGIEGLGLIPHHWRRTKLRYEVAISNGDFISDKLEDDGIYPVIGGNGQMGHTSGYNTDGEIVVVGRVGANCGNAHYIKGRAWISDNALIVHSNHDKRFLMHLFRALDFNSMARRTAQPLITSTQIKNTYVALPKIDEQVEIADFIQKQIVHFDELRNNLVKQIETLLAYRKSLIHECVTGQRRISEADLNQVKAYG
jgi:type I restriction enzyme S subunit